MAVIASEGARFSSLVKHEYEPSLGFCREAGAADLALGTVVGKVTATGAYVALAPAATDGSQNAAGVALADGTVLVRGPALVAKQSLGFGSATAAQQTTALGQLAGLGILAVDAK